MHIRGVFIKVLRQALVILAPLSLLAGGADAQPAPSPLPPAGAKDGDAPSCPTTHRAPSTIPRPTPAYPQGYFRGDWRLGPQYLPPNQPLGPLLRQYQRTDRESSTEFLDCYWNDQTHGWWFPDHQGFVLDSNGNPIETPANLVPGQRVDLFGTGTGRFLAPAGTPYELRALPPSDLNTIANAFPFGYHLYEVEKQIPVQEGATRPWFGQPGLGLQYFTGDNVTIPDLIANGSLKTLS